MRLDQVELEALADALHQRDIPSGYLDLATGEVHRAFDGEVVGPDGDPVDLDETDWIELADEIPSHRSFVDMETFAAALPPGSLRQRLEKTLGDRKPFRHFHDVMYRAPEHIGRAWSAYRGLGQRLRAIEWLVERGYVEGPDVRVAERETLEAMDAALARAAV